MNKLLFKLVCLLIPPLRKLSTRINQLTEENAKLKEENENNLISKLHKILWAEKDVRQSLEEAGIKISPNNFYANIPSVTEIESSFEYSDNVINKPPYIECDIFGSPQENKHLLDTLTQYSNEYCPPTEGDEKEPKGFFWANSQFSYSDAMSYYSFLRLLQPQNVVEIGSGFSTLVAADAIKKNQKGKILCIEPYPKEFMDQLDNIEIIKKPAQAISDGWLNNNLTDGDILFIDSTHTVKTGSDCLHIYLRLLPKIKHDIYVHVHDIFLPFGIEKDWLLDKHIYWTEQYLLLSFLLDNPKAKFLYGTSYHKHANYDLLKKFMHGRSEIRGASFWFEYSGTDNKIKQEVLT